jgi:hypothetical protein
MQTRSYGNWLKLSLQAKVASFIVKKEVVFGPNQQAEAATCPRRARL